MDQKTLVEVVRAASIKAKPRVVNLFAAYLSLVKDFKHVLSQPKPDMAQAYKEMIDAAGNPEIELENTSNGVVVKVKIIDWEKLDALTPTRTKRDLQGVKYEADTNPRFSKWGWWRYFEFGARSVNFGSMDFFFAGGKNGGGFMRKIKFNKLSNPVGFYKNKGSKEVQATKLNTILKAHPGVAKVGVFEVTWRSQEWQKKMIEDLGRIFAEEIANEIKRRSGKK